MTDPRIKAWINTDELRQLIICADDVGCEYHNFDIPLDHVYAEMNGNEIVVYYRFATNQSYSVIERSVDDIGLVPHYEYREHVLENRKERDEQRERGNQHIKYSVASRGYVVDDMLIKDSFFEIEPFATIIRMFRNGRGDAKKLKIVLRDALEAYEDAMWWRRHASNTVDYLKDDWYQTWKPGDSRNLT